MKILKGNRRLGRKMDSVRKRTVVEGSGAGSSGLVISSKNHREGENLTERVKEGAATRRRISNGRQQGVVKSH